MSTTPFANGDAVIVNTGGADSPATIEKVSPWSDSLRDSLLCRFENGTAQWIPRRYIRHPDPVLFARDLIADAAEASEQFGDDELERYAAARKEKP